MAEDDGGAHNDSVGPYSVGYCKPPIESRWQKGQSGNPSGRKKKSVSFPAMMERELNRVLTISEGGKPRRVPKKQALIMALVSNAIKGHHQSAKLLLEEMRRSGLTYPDPPEDDRWNDLTVEMVDEFIKKSLRWKEAHARKLKLEEEN